MVILIKLWYILTIFRKPNYCYSSIIMDNGPYYSMYVQCTYLSFVCIMHCIGILDIRKIQEPEENELSDEPHFNKLVLLSIFQFRFADY